MIAWKLILQPHFPMMNTARCILNAVIVGIPVDQDRRCRLSANGCCRLLGRITIGKLQRPSDSGILAKVASEKKRRRCSCHSSCGSSSRRSTSLSMAATSRTRLFLLRLLDSLHKNDPKKGSSKNQPKHEPKAEVQFWKTGRQWQSTLAPTRIPTFSRLPPR